MNTKPAILVTQIRRWIIFFIIALALSGITAFPVETELRWILSYPNIIPSFMEGFLQNAYAGIENTNRQYPFIAYGSDWLAFAHLVIAMAFIGPYRDPVRNKWVIEFGILACIAVIPFALITGQFRGIPLNWRLIDCSFGIVGLATLLVVYQKVITIEKIEEYFKEVRSKDLNENDNQIINQA